MAAVVAYRMKFYFIHKSELKDWMPVDFKNVLTEILPLALLISVVRVGGGALLSWIGID